MGCVGASGGEFHGCDVQPEWAEQTVASLRHVQIFGWLDFALLGYPLGEGANSPPKGALRIDMSLYSVLQTVSQVLIELFPRPDDQAAGVSFPYTDCVRELRVVSRLPRDPMDRRKGSTKLESVSKNL